MTATAPPPLVPARWFDGTHSRGQPVLVSLQPTSGRPVLTLHPLPPDSAPLLVIPGHRVGWPETWSARRPPARVTVDLRDQGSLEISAVAQWQAAQAAAGVRPGLAQRMQTHWPALLAMLLATVLGLTLLYRYGTPWAAAQLTRAVPLSWDTTLGEQALRQMDARLLRPSRVPAARQAALQVRFAELLRARPGAGPRGNAPRLVLIFRAGMGANAFALPGGTIVLTDGLVETADRRGLGDEALLGVLAHEIGHVLHRHTTRLLVEQGVLNIGLGLALGDVSSLLSTGGALLTGLAYQRDHEREADCHAMALLTRAGLPSAPMADLLLAIAQPDREQGHASPASPVGSLLSSHPDTVQRAAQLRLGRAPYCAP